MSQSEPNHVTDRDQGISHRKENGNSEDKTDETETNVENDSSENRLCRYCFEEEKVSVGNSKTSLVKPCACKGSSSWVHLKCLEQWQTSVLLNANRSNENENRHKICSTCQVPFAIKPPSRLEILRNEIGMEIAELIKPGSLLISSGQMNREISSTVLDGMPLPLRTLLMLKRLHWQHSIYLIIDVKPRCGANNEPELDWIFGLNLTREMDNSTEKPIPDRVLHELSRRPWIKHHNGGPVNWGKPEGLHGAFISTHQKIETSIPFQHDVFDIPLHHHSQSGDRLFVTNFDYCMSLTQTDEPARIHSFSGYARWSRVQLLAEIRRGSWGVVDPTIASPHYLAQEEEMNGLWERLSAVASHSDSSSAEN